MPFLAVLQVGERGRWDRGRHDSHRDLLSAERSKVGRQEARVRRLIRRTAARVARPVLLFYFMFTCVQTPTRSDPLQLVLIRACLCADVAPARAVR